MERDDEYNVAYIEAQLTVKVEPFSVIKFWLCQVRDESKCVGQDRDALAHRDQL